MPAFRNTEPGHPEELSYGFAPEILDILLPKHLIVQKPGIIRKIGPTLQKLLAPAEVIGMNIFRVVSFARPEGIADWECLIRASGQGSRIELQTGTRLKANSVFAPVSAGEFLLFDFSLGASVLDIIAQKNLTTQDFSPADQTAEMMFMKEAHTLLLESSRDLNTRLHGAKSLAEKEAHADPLTGLKNRRAMDQALSRALRRTAQQRTAILLIDLDRFKLVNDTYGHAAGDFTLTEVGKILASEVRTSDIIARLGGDEFVVQLNNVLDVAMVSDITRRIIERVSKPIQFKESSFSIGASIGVYFVETPTQETVSSVLGKADAALYQAKSSGRGESVVYNSPA